LVLYWIWTENIKKECRGGFKIYTGAIFLNNQAIFSRFLVWQKKRRRPFKKE